MTRTVKRLTNLEIDEVSLVDTPANQHGLVAIAKSYQEDNMAVFDATGNEVFEDELADGDLVYDEQGNEYRFVDGDSEEDFESDDEGEEEVGKGVRDAARFAGHAARHRFDREKLATQMFVGRKTAAARRKAAPGLERIRGEASGERLGQRARNTATAAGMQYRAIPSGGRAGIRYGGAAVAGGGATHEYDRRKVRKSFGDEVLTELSKALTDDDRDQVIAKALNQVEEIAKRNGELEEAIGALIADRELEGFGEIAKSYGLGHEQDIAGLLHRASQVLPESDLQLLDQVFSGAGEITKSYFNELGIVGAAPASSLDEIWAAATEVVVKNADSGMSEEQAVVALLAANPAAYDEYEAEQRYQR